MKMFSGAMLQWAYDFECRNSTAVNNLKRSAGASFVALLGQGHRSGWPYDGDLDERLSNDSTEHEKKIFSIRILQNLSCPQISRPHPRSC
jgi:hypothetical protein